MLKAKGCDVREIQARGKRYRRIPVGGEGDIYYEDGNPHTRCMDCGAHYGSYHHWGCDCECCPVCGQQLINCGCEDVFAEGRDKALSIRTGTAGQTLRIQPGGDYELFFSNSAAEARCVGHLRFDVDNCGKLWSSWWPHQAAREHNRQSFKDEFDAIVNALQRVFFRKPNQASRILGEMGIPCIDEDRRYYGFHIDTDAYSYYVRVFPHTGDYSYCYCYVREEEEAKPTNNIDMNLLGKTISIRGVNHICIAANEDTLLFLQMDESNVPCQYVVAHGVYEYENELCWLNGDYFLLPLNAESIIALKQAVEVML